MAAFDALKDGDILYQPSADGSYWTVRIVRLNPLTRRALVSWNGNNDTEWNELELKKLRRTPPKCKVRPWL